jgi:hypothetical protein
MRLKSISPFIASVLLIGFTISTGIIVYYFLTTLPKVQTQEISSQASRVLSCAGATFDVKVRNCNLLNGLVLWLPMDEGSGTIAYDYSGYGNNGTLYSGTNICSNPPNSGCPTWVDGKIGKALSFDGGDDYVRVENAPSLNYFDTGLTVVVWGMQTSYTGGADSWLLDKDYTGYRIWGLDRLRFGIRTPTQDWIAIGDTIPELNRWYHVVGVVDNVNLKVYLYVNGQLNATASLPVKYNFSNYNLPLMLGRHNTANRFWPGFIDEVRIYNRALSEDEIKELYYNGLTNKFNITIGLLNFGFADLGKSFTAIVYLKNGTILQLPLILDRDLNRGSYLEKTLTIDGYYPSYGLVDKIMVCSNDCQGVCSEIIVNNKC